jgi:hypothetical protein
MEVFINEMGTLFWIRIEEGENSLRKGEKMFPAETSVLSFEG